MRAFSSGDLSSEFNEDLLQTVQEAVNKALAEDEKMMNDEESSGDDPSLENIVVTML